jgi:DNA-binding NarL/FixJ family response regulator
METALSSFSNELSKLVQAASSSVVAIHARRHFASSGVHWGTDLVVTANHTIAREEDIRVTLPDGKTVDASLIGRDPVAARLNISEHTAKFHVASIMGKLGATSRTEAVTLGIRHGLVMI